MAWPPPPGRAAGRRRRRCHHAWTASNCCWPSAAQLCLLLPLLLTQTLQRGAASQLQRAPRQRPLAAVLGSRAARMSLSCCRGRQVSTSLLQLLLLQAGRRCCHCCCCEPQHPAPCCYCCWWWLPLLPAAPAPRTARLWMLLSPAWRAACGSVMMVGVVAPCGASAAAAGCWLPALPRHRCHTVLLMLTARRGAAAGATCVACRPHLLRLVLLLRSQDGSLSRCLPTGRLRPLGCCGS